MDFDVIIAGAGPGGCLAARDLAFNGFKVGLFDSDERGKVGKPVIVEAEKAMFHLVGVDTPLGDEVPYHAHRIRCFTGAGKEVFTVDGDHPAVSLYLDRFSNKLLEEAIAAGAVFHGGHRAIAPIVSGGKVAGAVFSRDGAEQRVSAKIVIDATGYNAALTKDLPKEFGVDLDDDPDDKVIAENHFYEIDPDGAKKAIQEGKGADQETWTRIGFAGNYSTEYIHHSLENRRVYMLVGHKNEYDGPPIGEYFADFESKRGYIGKRMHGGAGMIRIRHSLNKFVADGFMAIGEAACMVIPAHGSGVSGALYAGHLAAIAAKDALKADDVSTAALWSYPRTYQANRGGLLAVFDITRLTVEALTAEQMARMLSNGVTTADDVRNAAVPKGISMSPIAIAKRLAALARNRDIAPHIGKMALKSIAAQAHYSKYPKRYSPGELAAWSKKADELFKPFKEGAKRK